MRLVSRRTAVAGFSLVEVSLGLLLACILAGFGLLGMNAILPGIRANEGMSRVMAQLRKGRSLSMSQRRTVEVRFQGANAIQLMRQDWPPPAVSELGAVSLGNNCQFMRFEGVPDTPDGFGNREAVDFGGASSLLFLTDGTLADEAGDPVNGTVFVAVPGREDSVRAVTILGASGRIRSYRWSGTEWIP
jgi:Tfp pilus assembly protein FimT